MRPRDAVVLVAVFGGAGAGGELADAIADLDAELQVGRGEPSDPGDVQDAAGRVGDDSVEEGAGPGRELTDHRCGQCPLPVEADARLVGQTGQGRGWDGERDAGTDHRFTVGTGEESAGELIGHELVVVRVSSDGWDSRVSPSNLSMVAAWAVGIRAHSSETPSSRCWMWTRRSLTASRARSSWC